MNRLPTLDAVRTELRLRWPEWTAISVFAAVVAFVISYHEPWTDEAQGWQLARSLSLRSLFQTHIRYEATPGLWHFLLWILIRARASYTGMHWICGAIAVVAAGLLVFISPFPRYLKLTLPFTFFLVYQYAVIARGYLLVPLILFSIAVGWKKSPLVVAALLGLLANCALHAAAISGGLAIVYFVEELRKGSARDPARRHKLLLCASIVLIFYVFALWTAWPPADMAGHISFSRAARPSFLISVLAAVLAPICQPLILGFPFWIAMVLVFSFRRSISYLLPVLFFAVFSGVLPSSFWHWGMVVPLLISLLWITWPAAGTSLSFYEFTGRAALVYMAGVQILWAAWAIDFDHFHAYSPDLAAAQFLKPLLKNGTRIGVTYLDKRHLPPDTSLGYGATGILPYFDRNIYINQTDPFYWWSDRNQSESQFDALLPSHPGIVLAEAQQAQFAPPIDLQGPRATLLMKSGYRITNVFCGSLPFAMQITLTDCHVIFQYAGHAP